MWHRMQPISVRVQVRLLHRQIWHRIYPIKWCRAQHWPHRRKYQMWCHCNGMVSTNLSHTHKHGAPCLINVLFLFTVMAPSPSNISLNTPGQVQAAPSPLNPQEEQLYREKYRQLTKYIEPLKRMVARIANDGKHSEEKLLKMNKLLEILCNPTQRIPLETLVKCEIALEKMDLKAYTAPPSGTQLNAIKEQQVYTVDDLETKWLAKLFSLFFVF